MADGLFQIFPEGPAMDGLVLFTIMGRTILFYSEKCEIILDWPRAPDPRLVFDGIEDLVDGKPERNEML